MSAGDFLDLQTQLAVLAGRATAADLDEDLDLCKQVINEALLEIYRPVDGRAPEWARRSVPCRFRQPQTITIQLSEGETVVTGHDFTADCTGSIIAIGQHFYTYAGKDTANVHHLLQPAMEATGTHTATLHHNAFPLPPDVSEILGAPEVFGWGPLSPMTDRETEIYYRSIQRGDFHPYPGTANHIRADFGGNAYPSGTPLFYRVETDALLEGAPALRRLIILPLPAQTTIVTARAQVFPKKLVNDTDRPRILGDLIDQILLPIAREKWGVTYKKYTGQNQQGLIREANKAREIISASARPQKRFSGIARPGLR
ncbi:hypothetical protein [Geminisphaera colitermitum]|uniref:hypothetical protein n=1 Tax=Geminisphaera colitermitum TaxID=1148786 RepID=UPI000158C826|nr:hypothetical protein [Geminisphaera colitermitum]